MNPTAQKNTDYPEILSKTLALAESWQDHANTLRSKDELKQQLMMRCLLNHPSDKTVVMHLVDQSFRSGNPRRVIDHINSFKVFSRILRKIHNLTVRIKNIY